MSNTSPNMSVSLDIGALRHDLLEGLEQGRFLLNYQPVFSVERQRTVSVEALLRWSHPRWGALSPAVFLPVAEETGLTGRFSRLVLRETCAQMSEWRQELDRGLQVSINISRRQLHDDEYPDLVLDELDMAGLPANALALELQDRELDLLDEGGVENLLRLTGAGVGFCVDNFRADLWREPGQAWRAVDTLKLHPLLGRDVDRNPRRAAAVAAAAAYSRSLDLALVVKGIETSAQLDFLIDRHTEIGVQGYAVSAALGAEQVGEWIRRWNLVEA